jgi:hypothetical protein
MTQGNEASVEARARELLAVAFEQNGQHASAAAIRRNEPFEEFPFVLMAVALRAITAALAPHVGEPGEGVRERMCALLLGRDGADFDGEVHLTSAEAQEIRLALSLVPQPVKADGVREENERLKLELDRFMRPDARNLSTTDPITPLPTFKPQHLRGMALTFRSWPHAEMWGRPQEAELAARQAETAYLLIAQLSAALKPFSDALAEWGDDPEHLDRRNVWDHSIAMCITLGDFRKAAATLNGDIGIPISGPSLSPTATTGLDAATIEACAKAIRKASDSLGHVATDRMDLDNLAITLCTHFDNPDQDRDDENGWTEDAHLGCDETLKAIAEHYEAAIRALSHGDRA